MRLAHLLSLPAVLAVAAVTLTPPAAAQADPGGTAVAGHLVVSRHHPDAVVPILVRRRSSPGPATWSWTRPPPRR
jgi:hypothetical protein